jgi:hypothetical protein
MARNNPVMSKNVDAQKATSAPPVRNALQASTGTDRPDLVASAVAVRAAATKRAASSNQTIESSAIVVEDLAAATARFKVKRDI